MPPILQVFCSKFRLGIPFEGCVNNYFAKLFGDFHYGVPLHELSDMEEGFFQDMIGGARSQVGGLMA